MALGGVERTLTAADGTEDPLPEADGTERPAGENAPAPAPPARERGGPGDVAGALLAAVEPLWTNRRGLSAVSVQEAQAAARAAEMGVLALYAGVNAPRLRAAGQGGGSLVVRIPNPAPAADGGAGAAGVREIDRAFQRDARRYDGGLGPL